eukprot:TRINITY_DN9531_c0_g1_i3.p1 TRINITY_DN9531_c0_g1~~TRINITY_DN9531_c0_g1_i3.p1  ORF type:complete len:307 (+),score=48.08 TRINITY_DN9531_c0_g1_i3:111-1031(+)
MEPHTEEVGEGEEGKKKKVVKFDESLLANDEKPKNKGTKKKKKGKKKKKKPEGEHSDNHEVNLRTNSGDHDAHHQGNNEDHHEEHYHGGEEHEHDPEGFSARVDIQNSQPDERPQASPMFPPISGNPYYNPAMDVMRQINGGDPRYRNVYHEMAQMIIGMNSLVPSRKNSDDRDSMKILHAVKNQTKLLEKIGESFESDRKERARFQSKLMERKLASLESKAQMQKFQMGALYSEQISSSMRGHGMRNSASMDMRIPGIGLRLPQIYGGSRSPDFMPDYYRSKFFICGSAKKTFSGWVQGLSLIHI